jgi:hypothetical protein
MLASTIQEQYGQIDIVAASVSLPRKCDATTPAGRLRLERTFYSAQEIFMV